MTSNSYRLSVASPSGTGWPARSRRLNRLNTRRSGPGRRSNTFTLFDAFPLARQSRNCRSETGTHSSAIGTAAQYHQLPTFRREAYDNAISTTAIVPTTPSQKSHWFSNTGRCSLARSRSNRASVVSSRLWS